uniref:CCHC-type domain-containing protein n=1 Tax=Scleropages formosus TaxID=113540 RepID=A0A8C9S728_SCLFO
MGNNVKYGVGKESRDPKRGRWGASKGYLFYSNQPPFCRVCQGFGHTGVDCTNMRCNNCLEKGHMARDCNGPRRCNVCGAEDHLARTCSLRKPTYADTREKNLKCFYCGLVHREFR